MILGINSVVLELNTIGTNSLKGTAMEHCIENKVELVRFLKDKDLVFIYKAINENLPPENLVDDVVWLMTHGATSVKIKEKKI